MLKITVRAFKKRFHFHSYSASHVPPPSLLHVPHSYFHHQPHSQPHPHSRPYRQHNLIFSITGTFTLNLHFTQSHILHHTFSHPHPFLNLSVTLHRRGKTRNTKQDDSRTYLMTRLKLVKHRIVIWPDSRISDIRLYEKFNIRLSGRISGRCYPAGQPDN